MVPTEHQSQAAFVQWCELSAPRRPDLVWFHGVPNSGAGPLRGQCGKLVAEGMRRGVPDMHLPVARDAFTGLWIEFKRLGEKPTADQVRWLNGLAELNACTTVAWDTDDAIAITEAYLDGHIVLSSGVCPIGLTEYDRFATRHIRPPCRPIQAR